MKVTRFHNASVNTDGASLEDMVGSYRDVLGLEDQSRPEIPGIPGHWHVVGDQELHLSVTPSTMGGIDPTGNHFCVAVDDLGGAIAELEARGIEHVRAVRGERNVQIWIADPAGNTIELQQEASYE